MPTFLEMLNELRSTRPRKQYELAAELGISKDHLSRVFNGKNPSRQLIAAVEILYKKTFSSLPETVPSNVREDAAVAKKLRKIPVVSWAQAGQGVAFEDLCAQISEWVETDVQDQNAYALILEGDSMEPAFSAGDRVTVSPNNPPRHGKYVVAKLLSGEILFKRYFRTGPEGKLVRLESINPNYPPREMSEQEFIWICPVLRCEKILY